MQKFQLLFEKNLQNFEFPQNEKKKKPCSCQNFTKILQTQRANNPIESVNTKRHLKKFRINNSFQNINYKDLYMRDNFFFFFFW